MSDQLVELAAPHQFTAPELAALDAGRGVTRKTPWGEQFWCDLAIREPDHPAPEIVPGAPPCETQTEPDHPETLSSESTAP